MLNFTGRFLILDSLLWESETPRKSRWYFEQSAFRREVYYPVKLVDLTGFIKPILLKKFIFVRSSRLNCIQAARGERIETSCASNKVRSVGRLAQDRG